MNGTSKNYIGVLIESLEKKIAVLDEIQRQNAIQSRIIEEIGFDDEAFEATIDAKEKLIVDLKFLDVGFEAIYRRAKEELVGNKERHATEIAQLKRLITEVTEKSNAIQASEHRNDMNIKSKFRNEHAKIRQSKATIKAVSGYYQNMTNTTTPDSFFMDQKK